MLSPYFIVGLERLISLVYLPFDVGTGVMSGGA